MSPKSSERLWASPVPIPKTKTNQCSVSEVTSGVFRPLRLLSPSLGEIKFNHCIQQFTRKSMLIKQIDIQLFSVNLFDSKNFSNFSNSSLNPVLLKMKSFQKKVESDKWVFIEGCKNPQSVTLLIRGGSQRLIDEVDRSIHDSLMVVKDVIEKPEIVAGGGAPESYAASKLKDWADSFDGREQLAIKKYAEALEIIPLTIAENAGMDPIDTMATLRAKQNQGRKWTGIDARNTKIADMLAIDVVEPLAVKEQIIKSATEAACMILRIDDVISVSGAR